MRRGDKATVLVLGALVVAFIFYLANLTLADYPEPAPPSTTTTEPMVRAATIPEPAAVEVAATPPAAVPGETTGPVPTTPAVGSGLSTPIEDLIRLRFAASGYVSEVETAVRVARCESSLDRTEVGRYGERGLFQIHPVHINGVIKALGFTWDDMFEVEPNIEVAYALSRGGWGPWKGCM